MVLNKKMLSNLNLRTFFSLMFNMNYSSRGSLYFFEGWDQDTYFKEPTISSGITQASKSSAVT